MKIRPCRACGRKIWLVQNQEGKILPLDMETTVYDVMCRDGKEIAVKTNCFVSHFKTCPWANEFSKKKGKPNESASALPKGDGRNELLPGGGPVGGSAEASSESQPSLQL